MVFLAISFLPNKEFDDHFMISLVLILAININIIMIAQKVKELNGAVS